MIPSIMRRYCVYTNTCSRDAPTFKPITFQAHSTVGPLQLEATARSGRRTRNPAQPAPTTTFPARPTRPTVPTVRPASTALERATLPLRVAASRDITAPEALVPQPKTSWKLATTPPSGQVSSTCAYLGRTTTRRVGLVPGET